jgi:hypothetical protein
MLSTIEELRFNIDFNYLTHSARMGFVLDNIYIAFFANNKLNEILVKNFYSNDDFEILDSDKAEIEDSNYEFKKEINRFRMSSINKVTYIDLKGFEQVKERLNKVVCFTGDDVNKIDKIKEIVYNIMIKEKIQLFKQLDESGFGII